MWLLEEIIKITTVLASHSAILSNVVPVLMAPNWLLCLQELHLHSRQEESEGGKTLAFSGDSAISFREAGPF